MAITKIVLMICDDCDIVCQAQEGDVTCIECNKPMQEITFIRAELVLDKLNKIDMLYELLRKSHDLVDDTLYFAESAFGIKDDDI